MEEYQWDTSQGATNRWLKFHPNKEDAKPVVPEVIAVSDVTDVFSLNVADGTAYVDCDANPSFVGRVTPSANAYIVPIGEISYLRLADVEPSADNTATLATGELISALNFYMPEATANVVFAGLDVITKLPETTPKAIKNPTDAEIYAMASLLITARRGNTNAGVNPIKTSRVQTMPKSVYSKRRW
jgi:hypothetical protein